jgi:hypothetical protein
MIGQDGLHLGQRNTELVSERFLGACKIKSRRLAMALFPSTRAA